MEDDKMKTLAAMHAEDFWNVAYAGVPGLQSDTELQALHINFRQIADALAKYVGYGRISE